MSEEQRRVLWELYEQLGDYVIECVQGEVTIWPERREVLATPAGDE